MTEKEKMVSGVCYDCLDTEIFEARQHAHDLCHELSLCKPSDLARKAKLLRELLPHAESDMFITPPFFCDYGSNITIGSHFYCNTGCVILDAAPVRIGKHVLLGPNVQIYTATHAIDPDEWAALVQSALPVRIDDKVWIGGGAIVCPGVHIGEGSVIGAGSVIVSDIPSFFIAVGNPCTPVKPIKRKN